MAAADVAELERGVATELALPADRPRLRPGHLQVRVERVDRVRDVVRHLWIDRRRCRRWRQLRRIAEQHRQRAEVARRRVAVQRDGNALVRAEHAGEI